MCNCGRYFEVKSISFIGAIELKKIAAGKKKVGQIKFDCSKNAHQLQRLHVYDATIQAFFFPTSKCFNILPLNFLQYLFSNIFIFMY